MGIDPRIIWNIILTLGIGPLYWFIKRMANDIRSLDRRVTDHEIRDVQTFITKEDYHRDIDEIKGMLSDIFEILRAK